MKVIPQYKVIGPYNCDRVIRVAKKIMIREKIEVAVKHKDSSGLKVKSCIIG